MPQQLHHVVPVHRAVAVEVRRRRNGEFLREGDVPQKLHHIIPVHGLVQVDVAGQIWHHLHLVGRRQGVIGHRDGFGAVALGIKARRGISVGDNVPGAVGIGQPQRQTGGIQGFALQIHRAGRHLLDGHGFQRGIIAFPDRVQCDMVVGAESITRIVFGKLAIGLRRPSQKGIALPDGNGIADSDGFSDHLGLGRRCAGTAGCVICQGIGIPNCEFQHARCGSTGTVACNDLHLVLALWHRLQGDGSRQIHNLFLVESSIPEHLHPILLRIGRRVPGHRHIIIDDVIRFFRSQLWRCRDIMIRSQILQLDMAPLAVVFDIGPSGGGIGTMDIHRFTNGGITHIGSGGAVAVVHLQGGGTGGNQIVSALIGRTAAGEALGTTGCAFGIARIELVAAGLAFVVRLVGVSRFNTPDIIVLLVAALVIRHAEVMVLDEPLVGHDVVAFHFRIVGYGIVMVFGVALDAVEEVALHIPHQTHMTETVLKKQVARLRGIFTAVVIFHAKAVGVRPGAALDDIRGDLRLPGTPGNKHGAPFQARIAIPVTVFGVVDILFHVAQLCKCHTQNILPLIAGVDVGIHKFHASGIGCIRGQHDGAQQNTKRHQKRRNSEFLFLHFYLSRFSAQNQSHRILQ